MTIQDLEDNERTCIICDKAGCTHNLTLAEYTNDFDWDYDIELWLCKNCKRYVRYIIDIAIRRLIEQKQKEKLR